MAVLNKIIQKKASNSIHTLQQDDGTDTEPGLETLKLLARTHFPAATTDIPEVQYSSEEKCRGADLGDMYSWITPELTRRALRQFKPHKAPGPDGLRPLIFKYFPTKLNEFIAKIYGACVALGHTPLVWKKCKVIFLPKPGKVSYRVPKAFRPISLSNYLLKGLERLVVWNMDGNLEDKPIHPRQHGFTKGKSTESALSSTIDPFEYFVFINQHCLAVFLDISAAFDSIAIDHIRNALVQHGGNGDMVRWYYNLLKP